MKYEKCWVKKIANDLEKLSEHEFNKLDEEFTKILDSPNTKTERVKGWQGNIRRLKFHKYRLLIYVKEESLTAYALALLPRKNCYSKQSEKAIQKIVAEIRAGY